MPGGIATKAAEVYRSVLPGVCTGLGVRGEAVYVPQVTGGSEHFWYVRVGQLATTCSQVLLLPRGVPPTLHVQSFPWQ